MRIIQMVLELKWKVIQLNSTQLNSNRFIFANNTPQENMAWKQLKATTRDNEVAHLFGPQLVDTLYIN